MNDLVVWLTAQFDEREQLARAAPPGPWQIVTPSHRGRTWIEIAAADGCELYDSESGANEMDDATTYPYLVTNDPAYVLADIASKRAILQQHRPTLRTNNCRLCSFVLRSERVLVDAPCRTVRLLAVPFRGRPGWDPAWEVNDK